MNQEPKNSPPVKGEYAEGGRGLIGLVPKLRFPEFRDKGEWDRKKVSEIATLYKGKGISKTNIVANGGWPCIRYGELYTIYGERINSTVSSTNLNISELFLSKKNDVIIPASGETKIDIAKASCVMNDDIALGGDINIIRSSQNGIFLSYQLNGPLRLSIAKVAQGDTVVHLYPTQIERIDVLVPSPAEQQKIADCLASLDELVSLEAQKLDTLKAHKKGLMQQLFPTDYSSSVGYSVRTDHPAPSGHPSTGGEDHPAPAGHPSLQRRGVMNQEPKNSPPVKGEYAEGGRGLIGLVPKLRFPEFRDKGEWESKLMSELYDFKGNNSLSRDKLTYENGLIKNIHYGDIHTKFSTLFDITKENVPYVNETETQESFKAENYCVEGDIIFADASEDLNDIGKSIEIVRLNGERVVSGLHTILARQSGAYLVIGFGGYLFKSNAIRKQIQKESQGAKVLGISAGRLAKITIPFPSDKAEQQKIADCLASLDDLITAQTQKIEALKAHKKGLMQQLFPVMDEVKI